MSVLCSYLLSTGYPLDLRRGHIETYYVIYSVPEFVGHWKQDVSFFLGTGTFVFVLKKSILSEVIPK